MLIILIFIAACFAIGYLSYVATSSDDKDVKKSNALCGVIMSAILSSFILTCIWAASYKTYVDLEKKKAVIEQYKETVELYADKGVAEFHAKGKTPTIPLTGELTDLKYNNYQTQIGEMIRDMRDTIVSYNSTVASKRVMKGNIFFSWLIYLPEDVKTVKMADYLK